ncbi:unnamed protein product [Vitrella brassicaformis CCMP3155]|uniref:Coiled-coil domain-containing protein n=1 Tax=Vitrella brassicaformis (strain CCMP3155) TaxID=1169540 RepID=A0A0G4GS29_VITBC|nr:unnamed protein product [Vitrella brassicaformis CCMP3155]|mmetsp:Transcript_30608/g.89013  ORF Transcript_30608/g.89013 Transcript_30608/m.89013 type:complete len:225 (+) Transcript_30608:90-764(+)|eukprot:CEM33170.1 unnamed protein product [Vitrella brassicaformis CCMP3155]
MPNLGVNQKAVEARSRKAAAQAEKVAAEQARREDEYWRDDDKTATRIRERKEATEQRNQEQNRRKMEKKELLEAEERAMSKLGKKANPVKKMTRAEIAQRALLAAAAKPHAESTKPTTVDEMPLEPNINQLLRQQQLEAEERGDIVVEASGLDEAVSALSVGASSAGVATDLHPERRVKAVFKAYEDEWMPRLQQENPSLKRSQLQQLLWKQWKKAPENPFNQT